MARSPLRDRAGIIDRQRAVHRPLHQRRAPVPASTTAVMPRRAASASRPATPARRAARPPTRTVHAFGGAVPPTRTGHAAGTAVGPAAAGGADVDADVETDSDNSVAATGGGSSVIDGPAARVGHGDPHPAARALAHDPVWAQTVTTLTEMVAGTVQTQLGLQMNAWWEAGQQGPPPPPVELSWAFAMVGGPEAAAGGPAGGEAPDEWEDEE